MIDYRYQSISIGDWYRLISIDIECIDWFPLSISIDWLRLAHSMSCKMFYWSCSGPPKITLNPKEDSFFTWPRIERWKRTDESPIRPRTSTCERVPFEILPTSPIRSVNNLTKTSSPQTKLWRVWNWFYLNDEALNLHWTLNIGQTEWTQSRKISKEGLQSRPKVVGTHELYHVLPSPLISVGLDALPRVPRQSFNWEALGIL